MDGGLVKQTPQLGLERLQQALRMAPFSRTAGRVVEVKGLLVHAELPSAAMGAVCEVGDGTLCEIVGFQGQRALLMPLEDVTGIEFGAPVRGKTDALCVPVGPVMMGRVVDALGRPIDGGPKIEARATRSLLAQPPTPMSRPPIRQPLRTGVRVIDGLCTLGKGQRIAITAGAGVGKSTLLAMLARHVDADATVVCLVGERGREVREFIEESLGPEGLERSVVVVATSDASPAVQLKAALAATTMAEALRDEGRDVLLVLDSLTRLAHAQRLIGLSAGEPPTTRGYTPSVFALLPRLLERAGPGSHGGSITGLYTVLVEADDPNDPVSDAVRGIVDGHLLLSRDLAHRGHFPAVDVLGSLSRLMNRVASSEHMEAAARFRSVLTTWRDNEELVRLGVYNRGSSPAVDHAVSAIEWMDRFTRQRPGDNDHATDLVAALRQATDPPGSGERARSG